MDIQAVALVIAIVDAIKKVVPVKFGGIITIVVAAVAGGLLGLTAIGWETSVGFVQGAINGLVAVGVMTTAKRVGNS